MKIDFNTRVINRGITRTTKSLQSPNDAPGKTLLQKSPQKSVDVNEILENKNLMKMAQDFYNKYIK